MNKRTKIFGSIFICIVYCFVLCYSNSCIGASESSASTNEMYFSPIQNDLSSHALQPDNSSVPFFKIISNDNQSISTIVELLIVKQTTYYILHSKNDIIPFKPEDIIFPYQYFW